MTSVTGRAAVLAVAVGKAREAGSGGVTTHSAAEGRPSGVHADPAVRAGLRMPRDRVVTLARPSLRTSRVPNSTRRLGVS
ncbi:hypothetical protein [Actinoallomurus rhizosphaericola]|uniref:hypothetical protein n=1 Tax=Actinoallomurus rhizosphaericola TaxID=2952536 RepID=UPI002092B4E1|nr:hypothetical protein [Actinoallomurus rhizosphaericola]MCO5999416.1 hypothetical protein [Actinoallomurus rhizosphaericola]